MANNPENLYEVPESELKAKVLDRLQKEPMKTLLVDDFTTRFKLENPLKFSPEHLARLGSILQGNPGTMKASDKPLIIGYLKNFASYVESKTAGSVGRGNAWKTM